MMDTGVIVAIVAAITGAIIICLQKCRFLYNHHSDGLYELVIGFERETTEQSHTE